MPGTLVWSAPESFFKRSDERSDVFSFAMVVYEIISRTLPYKGKSMQEIDRIVKARFELSKGMLKMGVTEEQQCKCWKEEHPLSERRYRTSRPSCSGSRALANTGFHPEFMSLPATPSPRPYPTGGGGLGKFH